MKYTDLNMGMLEFFNMGWKHFWLNGEVKEEIVSAYYCINSYGALTRLNPKYENVWLKYDEIIEILSLKNKKEKYNLCDKLFKEKYSQLGSEIKELSKQEQSKLEKLFP